MKILGLSGKKQSGKNTAANFLFGNEMVAWGIIDQMEIDDKGRLIVPADNEKGRGIFDPLTRDFNARCWLAENVWQYVKIYSFADTLKDVAMVLFGLTDEQCYGTDEQKNTSTRIKWADVPTDELGEGFLTAREFLQYFGSKICRVMYPDIWADNTMRRITEEGSTFAIICDVRFPNEVRAIQKAGGKVIRFTRQPCEDNHESETALDPSKFPWNQFDAIVDNANMTIKQQNVEIYNVLQDWGYVGDVEE